MLPSLYITYRSYPKILKLKKTVLVASITVKVTTTKLAEINNLSNILFSPV